MFLGLLFNWISVVLLFLTPRWLARDGRAGFSPLMFVDNLDLNIFQGSSEGSGHLWLVLYVTYVQLAFHDLRCVACVESVCCAPMASVFCVCVCVCESKLLSLGL